MIHEIIFNDKHSYGDFGLILNNKTIEYPKPRTNYLTIEGSNGDIDLSNVLSNEMTYDDRKLSFEFTVMDLKKWREIKEKVANYIHGNKVSVKIWDDPEYTFFGRAEINDFKTEKTLGKLVIDVKANPFKYERVHDVYSFTSNGTYKIYMPEYLKDIRNFEIHSLKSPKSATVSVNGKSISIPSTMNGTEWNKMNDVVLYKKLNTFEFTSSRTESITVEFSYEIGVI